jgi:hypothetical protein
MTLMGGLFGLGGPHSQYSDAVNDRFRRFIARYKEVRHLLEGDFYPLLPQPSTSDDWDAWQFHDPAGGKGLLMVFRMRGGGGVCTPRLRALEDRRTYRLRGFPSGRDMKLSGAAMSAGELDIPLPPWGAEMILYEAE